MNHLLRGLFSLTDNSRGINLEGPFHINILEFNWIFYSAVCLPRMSAIYRTRHNSRNRFASAAKVAQQAEKTPETRHKNIFTVGRITRYVQNAPSTCITSSHRFATAKQMWHNKLMSLWMIAHSSLIACHSAARFGNRRWKMRSFEIPKWPNLIASDRGDCGGHSARLWWPIHLGKKRSRNSPTATWWRTILLHMQWLPRKKGIIIIQFFTQLQQQVEILLPVMVPAKKYRPSRLWMVTPTHTVTPGTFSCSWSTICGLSMTQ